MNNSYDSGWTGCDDKKDEDNDKHRCDCGDRVG